MDNADKEKDRGDKGAEPNLQPPGSQPSAAEQLTSKIEEDKQYAGVDVKKMVLDALSANGREQKDRAEKAETNLATLNLKHEALTTQFNTVSGQVGELIKDKDEAEIAKVGDDPAAIGSLRARQANATESRRLEGVKADYDAKNTKLTERLQEATQRETSISIKLVALATGVDEKQLVDLVPDGNVERLTKAANIIKQGGSQEIDPATGKPKPAALTQPPASVVSAGGGGETGVRQIVAKAKERAGVKT